MWLINTETYELEDVGDPEGHEYAILSHTWGPRGSEVSFQDMADLSKAKAKPMFSKIAETCRIARERQLKWAWVETCCIDKSSSAELTEAINSMYRWYKNSTVCFVYLSDLPVYPLGARYGIFRECIVNCRWFERGWTLQELIAPAHIVFYDLGWNAWGNKRTFEKALCERTRIPRAVMADSESLKNASIAMRMSWAAGRKTTRVEDLAYCLFGIFDVNLPLIYGEGGKAFIRLQEAILAESSDLSLFAWTAESDKQLFRGLFARHPDEFSRCSDIERRTGPASIPSDIRMTNKGCHITDSVGHWRGGYTLDLNCSNFDESSSDRETVAIRLVRTAHGFVRYKPNEPQSVSPGEIHYKKDLPVYIPKDLIFDHSKEIAFQRSHSYAFLIDNKTFFDITASYKPAHLWDEQEECFYTAGHRAFIGAIIVNVQDRDEDEDSSECIIFLGINKFFQTRHYSDYDKIDPWATIFPTEGEIGFMATMLADDAHFGFPLIQAKIETALQSRLSRDESLQNKLPVQYEFRPTSGGHPRITTDGNWYLPVTNQNLRLSLETNIRDESYINKYETTLVIETCD